MFFQILIAIALAIIAGYLYAINKFMHFKRQGIPYLKPKIFFGNLEGSIRNRQNIVYDIDALYKAFKNKVPFCGYYQGFRPYILAIDPELIRAMFISDFSKFRNNDFWVNEKNDPIMARNPFWMRDEAWKEKRVEVIQANSSVKLKAMFPLINAAGKNLTNFITAEIAKNPSRAFDSRDISARYTCDSICSTTFGCEAKSFSEDKPFFLTKGRELIRGIADSLQAYFSQKMLPGAIEQFFIDIAKEAIKTRIESKIQQDDFLNHTIQLQQRKNMSDIDAAAHCVTLFLDGYETTSVTLHHALYELGYDKRVQSKLRDEIVTALGDEEMLTYDKMLELPYLNQVFYETMRLHPPLVNTSRWSSEDYQYEGYDGKMMTIKKDMPIWIPIPTIQRDPEYYTDPDTFNPDRFNPEFGGVKAFKDKMVLIPFGDGPRICSGMRFAYMQVKAAIVHVVMTHEISIDKSVPDQKKYPEAFHVSPYEFVNVPRQKLYLNFKRLEKVN